MGSVPTPTPTPGPASPNRSARALASGRRSSCTRSASRNGANGPAPARAVPESRPPSHPASASVTSRLLPTPASPLTSTSPPVPERHAVSASTSRARSSSRPTNGVAPTVATLDRGLLVHQAATGSGPPGVRTRRPRVSAAPPAPGRTASRRMAAELSRAEVAEPACAAVGDLLGVSSDGGQASPTRRPPTTCVLGTRDAGARAAQTSCPGPGHA